MAGIDHALEGIPRYAANKKKKGGGETNMRFPASLRRSFLFLFRFKKKIFF